MKILRLQGSEAVFRPEDLKSPASVIYSYALADLRLISGEELVLGSGKISGCYFALAKCVANNVAA